MGFGSRLTAALLLSSTALAADCSNTLKPANQVVTADGWTYRLVANGFKKPRGIIFDKEGGLLVVDSGAGLVHLTLKDDGGTCVSVSKNTTLINNKDLNHGVALSSDEKTLYASSASDVYAWSYDGKGVKVGGSNRTIVANMSNSDHTTRTLLMSQKKPSMLLVSRGSDSNEDENARELSSGHSQIRAYDLSKQSSSDDAYDFMDGHLMGWGLRNSVGVAEDPIKGGIWAVENSVDQLYRNGKDIHQDNPGEELNYLGVMGSSDHQGGNYGYPNCYAIWGTSGFPDKGKLTTANQFADDDAPKNVTDEKCNSDYVEPMLAFQAHTAPLDIKFTKNGSTAYIAFHGSWDRTDPVGYRIASIAFKDGMPSAAKDSTDAAKDVVTNMDNSKCPDDCFRPVGLAWDSKDRLWFTSDSTGELFVLQHNGSSSNDGGDGGDGNTGGGDTSSSVHSTPGLAVLSVMATVAALLLA